MAENIADYRKKRRRKRLIGTIYFSLIVVVIVAIIIYSLSSGKFLELDYYFHNIASANQFPVSIKEQSLIDLETTDNYIAVLSKSSLFFFDQRGNKVKEEPHGYTNPQIKVHDDTVILYDCGGYQLKVLTPFTSIAQRKTEEKILTCDLATNHTYAVATLATGYSAEVTVYDRYSSVLYQWFPDVPKLITLALSADGKTLYTGCITSDDGIITTLFYRLDLSNPKKEVYKVTVAGAVPLSISEKEGGTTTLITTSGVRTYDKKGKLLHKSNLYTDLVNICSNERYTVTISKNLQNNLHAILIVNAKGEEVYAKSLNAHQIDCALDEDMLYILGNGILYQISISKKEMTTVNLDQEYRKVSCSDKGQFLLNTNSITRLDHGALPTP